jgi:glycyl-tRNA synthetase
VREFTQAEIEHFCSPDDKSHPKFASVADLAPLLFSRELQMGAEKVAKPMSLREAVDRKIVANETLAYFIGRTHLFLLAVGIDAPRLRFRQHLVHEMAHYAEDCWDAEVHCSYGWIECAGLADRSAFDLTAHSAKSKQDLSFFERFPEPRTETRLVARARDRKALGVAFKKEAKAVLAALEALSDEGAAAMQKALEAEGRAPLLLGEKAACCGEEAAAAPAAAAAAAAENSVEVTADQVSVESVTQKVSGRSIVPSVIEPSFGIGRIIYCAFEHSFYAREEEPKAAEGAAAASDKQKGSGDAQRTVFRFAPAVAPVKVTVFPLLNREAMDAKAREIERALTAVGLATLVDTTSTTVGKRYARTDEIGVPFGVTVDGASLEDGTATLRERDSMAQVRVPISELPGVVRALVDGKKDWASVQGSYPAQAAPADK